jgi:hypothetical protein
MLRSAVGKEFCPLALSITGAQITFILAAEGAHARLAASLEKMLSLPDRETRW